MKVLVVNCSAPHYNLGASKLYDWLTSQGHQVERAKGSDLIDEAGEVGFFALGYDLVCLSVIFSWHAPLARAVALRVMPSSEVWCGGPGMRAMEKWWKRETGLDCTRGLDDRFEKHRGDYKMTFASRGCGENCWFCVVPLLEGSDYALDWNFKPAPVLCDNNLAGLPEEFQRFIVSRYRESGVKLVDANSGFAPRQFTPEMYEIWRPVVSTWRFALDETKEIEDARRMLGILRDVSASRKRVYVLAGHEPIEACRERAELVRAEGGEPFCQPFIPLNFLHDPRDPAAVLPARFDWSSTLLRDFCRYYNRWLWRTIPIWEYKPRKNEPPPFAFMQEAAQVTT